MQLASRALGALTAGLYLAGFAAPFAPRADGLVLATICADGQVRTVWIDLYAPAPANGEAGAEGAELGEAGKGGGEPAHEPCASKACHAGDMRRKAGPPGERALA